jgi:hypothetical protein
MKVFVCVVAALAISNAAVVKREADAEADADAYFPYHAAVAPVAPLVYHAPNCTTVEETVTLKQCTPKIDNKCDDVEVPIQKIEFEEVCNDITHKICTPKVVEATGGEEAAEKVKREADAEADADAQFLGYHGYPVVAPVVAPVLYTTVCEDKVQQVCHKKPVVVAATQTVKSCQAIHSVDCADIEHKVPRTTCVHATHAIVH